MSKSVSRRGFLKISSAGIAATAAAAVMGRAALDFHDQELPDPYPVIPDKKTFIPALEKNPLYFNSHQYSLVAVLAALIIPTDDHPGATEAGVADHIDNLVAGSDRKKKQYDRGLDWIDKASRTQYGKDFLRLSVTEQIELLMMIEDKEAISVSTLPERVYGKLYRMWDEVFGIGSSFGFFHAIRNDVLKGYYSSPVSWKAVGYYGPPQPVGYLDYAEKPSSLNYIDTVRPISDKTCLNCHFDQTEKEDHEGQDDCMECHEPHFPLQG